jgi:hypothetical protein
MNTAFALHVPHPNAISKDIGWFLLRFFFKIEQYL